MMNMNDMMNGMRAFGWLGLLLGAALLIILLVGTATLLQRSRANNALDTSERDAQGDLSREALVKHETRP